MDQHLLRRLLWRWSSWLGQRSLVFRDAGHAVPGRSNTLFLGRRHGDQIAACSGKGDSISLACPVTGSMWLGGFARVDLACPLPQSNRTGLELILEAPLTLEGRSARRARLLLAADRIVAALLRGRPSDVGLHRHVAAVTVDPAYVGGTVLVLIFASWLRWLPARLRDSRTIRCASPVAHPACVLAPRASRPDPALHSLVVLELSVRTTCGRAQQGLSGRWCDSPRLRNVCCAG